MLQLPHITEDMQKYFLSKKRQITSIQQFCEMKEEDRRSVLKSLSEDQYADVMKVCSTMPLIDFKVNVEGNEYNHNDSKIYVHTILSSIFVVHSFG